MTERWKVFYNKKTGKKYVSYTIRGESEGEEEGTRQFEAALNGIAPEEIGVRIEERRVTNDS